MKLRRQVHSMGGRFVVAVSGGVDSVVLLDFLWRLPHEQIIVAHFDHGIRATSAADARFVEALAQRYGCRYEGRREELGAQASEEVARHRRYAYLKELARTYDAQLVTAHHADDVVETMALNLQRGTGWRGIAAMTDPAIDRPLLAKWKHELIAYALEKRLEWVEDETNATDSYTRNQLRRRIAVSLSQEQKQQLLTLWQKQVAVRHSVEKECATLLTNADVDRRYFVAMISLALAMEVVGAVVLRDCKTTLTRPQLESAVLAIRAAKAGTVHCIARHVQLRCELRTWSVQLV